MVNLMPTGLIFLTKSKQASNCQQEVTFFLPTSVKRQQMGS